MTRPGPHQALWSRAQLQALDQAALADQPELMEVAGAAFAQALAAPGFDHVEIWAGPGNNGGDGFVAARHLLERGIHVSIWLPLGPPTKGQALAAWNRLPGRDALIISKALQEGGNRVVADCLFGTGLSRGLSGDVAEAATASHDLSWPVIACDLPSGLDADSGQLLGPTVRADHTVTFGGYKLGFFGDVASAHHGSVDLVTLGFTDQHRSQAGDVQAWLAAGLPALPKEPPAGGSKVSQGRILALAGSPGMEGAAMLALSGLKLGGAGLVHLRIPQVDRSLLPGLADEVMVAADSSQALAALSRCRAAVAGCGLSREPVAWEALRELLEAGSTIPWVLDADALWHLAQRPTFPLPETTLLTPHEGEARRLLDGDVSLGRVQLAQALQARFACWVLLKGPGNVLAGPSGDHRTWVFPGGNRALARAGSGDVLAGLIAALLGRGMVMEDAVHLAVHLQLAGAEKLKPGEREVAGQEELRAAFAQAWDDLKNAV